MTKLVCMACRKVFYETESSITTVLARPMTDPTPPEWLNEGFRHWRDTGHDVVLIDETFTEIMDTIQISIIRNACQTLGCTVEELRRRLEE